MDIERNVNQDNRYLLDIRGLKTTFYTADGVVPAVDGVSFGIKPGETVGVVGESGCGKSVTALSIMRLIPYPPGKIEAGQILFEGEDLLTKSDEEMRSIRGNKISMIFQEPMTSLNPVYTIGDQIGEVLEFHRHYTKQQALERTISLLSSVGIPEPEKRVNQYPHELSGGMRQRVMIAMALACDPQLLIADEPTTALDVTIQAQILEVMRDVRERFGTAIMLITHDLGVVAEMAERVVVMYLGRVVEEAPVREIFYNPLHPYTNALLKSIPRLGRKTDRLHVIPGAVPNPMFMPEGCKFHARCSFATDRCRKQEPDLREPVPGHKVRCFYPLANGTPSQQEEVNKVG
ncbi:MAG TPA: ABC transporter ATP-binding protein [Bacillota bacterium]|nr:ABC transporter ATP-binding protein [Candidatus Fermentithermobacillaceae bacterium]HOA71436.1 ABC transporter ATP-binding protein [Bacillota bacterium]HPZ86002.1 ABC transporter ATP-binding protein [Bacillota bacterium]HQD86462.1 ABC transporter ATP-binding protein [Bacillota bacterium]